jgi:hypothetical protein
MRLPVNWAFLALRAARRKAATHRPRRAVAATPSMVEAMRSQKGPKRIKMLALLTFVSASRFDDLTRKFLGRPTTTVTVRDKSTIRVKLPVDKGQPFGRRAVKWLKCPNLIRLFSLPKGRVYLADISYGSFLRHTKRVQKWTGHSGRRGACTQLSRMGFDLRRIQALTLHSGSESKALESIRQYVEISRHMPEARRQLRMSGRLDKLIRA